MLRRSMISQVRVGFVRHLVTIAIDFIYTIDVTSYVMSTRHVDTFKLILTALRTIYRL